MLEVQPKIGLSLFEEAKSITTSQIDMNPFEIIEFLKSIESKYGNRDDTFPYVEHYLEYLVQLKDVPDRFFTDLALIYIEKLFVCLPAGKL